MYRYLILLAAILIGPPLRNDNVKRITNFDKILIKKLYSSPERGSLFLSLMSFDNTQTRRIIEHVFRSDTDKSIREVSCNGQVEFLRYEKNRLTVFIGTGINSNSINSLNLLNGNLHSDTVLTTDDDSKYAPHFYRPLMQGNDLLLVSQVKSRLEVCQLKQGVKRIKSFDLHYYSPMDLCMDSLSASLYILQVNSREQKFRVDKLDLETLKLSRLIETSSEDIGQGVRSAYSGIAALPDERLAIWLDKSSNDQNLSSSLFIVNEKEQRIAKRFELSGLVISDLVPSSISENIYAALTYCNGPEKSAIVVQSESEIRAVSCLESNVFEVNIKDSEPTISFSDLDLMHRN